VADELDLAILHAPEEGADVSELWSKAYPELRQLARARLRRSGRHSLLDTTGLVNEAYTRLAAIGRLQLDHRGQFFAYSARAMRSIILNLARSAFSSCTMAAPPTYYRRSGLTFRRRPRTTLASSEGRC
jgi:DNA-directed RNA polymerase specialized sigma24 family protein